MAGLKGSWLATTVLAGLALLAALVLEWKSIKSSTKTAGAPMGQIEQIIDLVPE